MPKKPRGKSSYLVTLDYPAKGDTLRTLEVLYSGTDRNKARAVAEKTLSSSNDSRAVAVLVMRVTRSVTLTDDSLVASLPRSAF